MEIKHQHDLAPVYEAIDQIKPYRRNARAHPEPQIDQIQRSIVENGYTNPILIDEDRVIIAGHGRFLAAKKCGMDQIPCIILRGLSANQRRALRLADNKIAQSSAWDMQLLATELTELSGALDIEFAATGFEIAEADAIVNKHRDAEPALDHIPALAETPVSRSGDIWLAGPHVVGVGDARDRAFVTRVMKGAMADVAFLDVPYNVSIRKHAGGKGKRVHREFAMASGEMDKATFTTFLTESLSVAAALSRSGAVHFGCIDQRHIEEMLAACGAIYDKRLNLCIWNKSNAGMGDPYRSKYEFVAVHRVGSTPHYNAVKLGRYGRHRTNVWDYPSVNTFGGARRHDLALHPTVKPVALVADAIMDVTKPGEIVLDTFLGSGSTLLACDRVDRIFRGLDIDPLYVDLALQRWSAITGETAVLDGTGATWADVRRDRDIDAGGAR